METGRQGNLGNRVTSRVWKGEYAVFNLSLPKAGPYLNSLSKRIYHHLNYRIPLVKLKIQPRRDTTLKSCLKENHRSLISLPLTFCATIGLLLVLAISACTSAPLPAPAETTLPATDPIATTSPTPAPTAPPLIGGRLEPRKRLRIATTTSPYDTGLWGYLEPMFEEKYDVELDVMYAGTGKAIEYGRRGDVDVITVHSRSREEQFVADGYGLERIPFAYNYFLIVGPENDPAALKDLEPEEAFSTLMAQGSSNFVSRGDGSGTHGKEKTIWQQAGYEYGAVQVAGEWYVEAGIGMGPVLNMANELEAYTLTDMGTYLAYKKNLNLVPIVDQGSILLNVYSAITCNPEVTGVKNMEMAQNLVGFLASEEIQQLIGNYGVSEYGLQLFIPCAGNEPSK